MHVERPEQEGLRRPEPPPRGDGRQLARIERSAGLTGLQAAQCARERGFDVQGGEGGAADGLLDGVHKGEQRRRREHPVAALYGALEDMVDAVRVGAGTQALVARVTDHPVEELPQPLPDAQQLEVVGVDPAREGDRCHRTLGQVDSQDPVRRIPGRGEVDLTGYRLCEREPEARALLPVRAAEAHDGRRAHVDVPAQERVRQERRHNLRDDREADDLQHVGAAGRDRFQRTGVDVLDLLGVQLAERRR